MCLSVFPCTLTSCSSSRMHVLCSAVTTSVCPKGTLRPGSGRLSSFFACQVVTGTFPCGQQMLKYGYKKTAACTLC